MKQAFIILLMLAMSGTTTAQTQPETKRYTKVPTGYLMVLRQDDNVMDELKKFAQKENIPSANFTGMGFVDITFGYFNFKKKEFKPKSLKDVELASMHGTIAWQKDTVSIHAHGVVGNKRFRTYSGHILGAVVGTGSVEIMIIPHDKRLERVMEEELGANVLRVE